MAKSPDETGSLDNCSLDTGSLDTGTLDTGTLDRSRTLARLMGPVLVAMAASLLLNRPAMPELAAQISQDWGVIYLSGVVLLVAGIAIVERHNVWHGGWPVIVTVLGWMALVGGLARILFFRQLAALASRIVANPPLIVAPALLLLLVGVFLTLKGFKQL